MAFKVTEIYADISAKDKGFKSSMVDAQHMAQATSHSFDKLAGMAAKLGASISAGFIIHEAMDTEKNILKLKVALEASGQEFVKNTTRLVSMSKALSELTGRSNQEYLEAMKLATGYGMKAKSMRSIMEASEGLAQILDTNLEAALHAVAQAQEGHYTVLQRRLPTVWAATTAQGKFNEVMRAASIGFATAQANTLSRSLNVLKVELLNLLRDALLPIIPVLTSAIRWLSQMLRPIIAWAKENPRLATTILSVVVCLGLLAPIIMPLIAVIGGLIQTIVAIVGFLFTWVGALIAVAAAIAYCIIPGDSLGKKIQWLWVQFQRFLNWVTPYWNAFVDAMVYGVAVVIAAFHNWKLFLALALTTILYAVVRFANQIAYFFSEYIPAAVEYLRDNWTEILGTIASYILTFGENLYLNLKKIGRVFTEYLPYVILYFADNWKDHLKTLLEYVVAFFENLGTNIYNFGKALISYIGSGFTEDWNFKWKSLTDGAQNYVKEAFEPPDLGPWRGAFEGAENFVRKSFEAPLRVEGELEKELRERKEKLQKSAGTSIDIEYNKLTEKYDKKKKPEVKPVDGRKEMDTDLPFEGKDKGRREHFGEFTTKFSSLVNLRYLNPEQSTMLGETKKNGAILKSIDGRLGRMEGQAPLH